MNNLLNFLAGLANVLGEICGTINSSFRTGYKKEN